MIRYARAADRPDIAAVIEAAFGRADEVRLVDRLRTDGDALFELVAVEADAVIGHVLFSRLWADRLDMFAALAPISVRPEAQRAGHGAALIRAGLEMVREFGAHGVLVLGHPDYYPRFGFSTQAAAGVTSPYSGLLGFMALAIEPGAFDAPLTVAYPDAFAA